MKILICCGAGMSSQIIVKAMREELEITNVNHRVAGVGINQLTKYIDQADIVLLAPQMRFQLDYINKLTQLYHVPTFIIGRSEFGNVDAKAILSFAIDSYEQNKMEDINMETKLEKFLSPIANWMGSNIVLKAVSSGFMRVLPITIAGSLITLIANFPITQWTNFLTSSGLMKLLSLSSSATLGIISIYVVAFIAFSYAEIYEKDGVSASLLAIVSFVIVTPLMTEVISSTGEVVSVANVLPLQWLGAAGLFSAIIIAVLSTRLYVFIVDKNIKINMPESVPTNIARPFEALIPSLIGLVVMLIISYAFDNTAYGSMHNFIYNVIQLPLQGMTSSFWVVCIIAPFLFSLFWFFGLHAGQILIFPILIPLLLPASLGNLAAYQAGTTLPNILTYETLYIGQSLGGVGNTIGLCIVMLLFAKSRRYKMMSKMSIVPAMFCINEPIIFGTPIVMNPIMLIPFIVAPIVTSIITYVTMQVGLVPYISGVQLPWTTPIILFGFLECGIAGAILQIVLVIISVFIYYPFFKTIDKKAKEEELRLELEKGLVQ